MAELFRTILNLTVQGSWAIGAVLVLRLALRRAPKRYSYALWLVVLFRLVCPFSFESAVSLFAVTGQSPAPVPPGFGVPAMDTVPVPSLPAPGSAMPSAPGAAYPMQPVAPAVPQAAALGLSTVQLLAFAWAAGVAVMAGYSLWQLAKLHRQLRFRTPGADGVYRVNGLCTAFVLGVLRPRIYLPAGLAWEEERCILAHERAHIRHGDSFWRLAAYAALCLHWFNPLVWVAFVCSGRDMEMCCDEAVVRRFGPGVKKQYSASLLALAAGQHLAVGGLLAFGEGDTRGRIQNVLRYKKPGFWVGVLATAAVVAGVVVLAANPAEKPEAEAEPNGNRITYTYGALEAWATLPEQWQTVPAQNGAGEADLAIFLDRELIGSLEARFFPVPERLPAVEDPNRHMVAYNSFMLGSMADWNTHYTVLQATEGTERAITTVLADRHDGEEPRQEARAALYFDLEIGAYVRVVLQTDAFEITDELLCGIANSLDLTLNRDYQDAQGEPNPSGWFFTVDCLYMSPLSSFLPINGDSGEMYYLDEDGFSIYKKPDLTTPTLTVPSLQWNWQPVDPEEWRELYLGLGEWGAVELSANSRAYVVLAEGQQSYRLYRMDEELWLAKLYQNPDGALRLWSLYSLHPASFNGGPMEQQLSVWYADLNHDGTDERLTMDVAQLRTEGWAALRLSTEDGHTYDAGALSTAHAGWVSFAVWTRPNDGRQFLLEYEPYCSTGAGCYTMTLWELSNAQGWLQPVERQEVGFVANLPTDVVNDNHALAQFAADATEIWKDCRLLVSTDGDTLPLFTDNKGRALWKGTEPFYLSGEGRGTPCRYVETMPWVAQALEENGQPVQPGETLEQQLARHSKLMDTLRSQYKATGMGGGLPKAEHSLPSLLWPVPGYTEIAARYVPGSHEGVDICAGEGAEILAPAAGTVTAAGWGSDDEGYVVALDHGNGCSTVYSHCGAVQVKVGQAVAQGQCIANVGNSGKSTGAHCHWQLLLQGESCDPLACFEDM